MSNQPASRSLSGLYAGARLCSLCTLLLVCAHGASYAQSATRPKSKKTAQSTPAAKTQTPPEKVKAEGVPARRAPEQPTAPAEEAKPSAAAASEARPAADDSAAKGESAAESATKDNEKGAAAKPDVETELEELRAKIKDAGPGAERARLQRELAERLVGLGRKAEALDQLRLMIHEDRLDPTFFYNVGNALARLGDSQAALDAYRKAVGQRRGNYPRALNNMGVILIRLGRWAEAQDALTAALAQENNTYAEASYNLGRLHLLRGENGMAIREWTRTLRLQPDHADAAAALARAYAEDGSTSRAYGVLEKFTARNARAGGGVPLQIAQARNEISAARAETEEEEKTVASLSPAPAAAPAPASTPAPAVSVVTRPAAASATRPTTASISAPSARRRSPARFRAYEVDRQSYELLQSARAARDRGRNEEAVREYRRVLDATRGGYLPPANMELSYALINLGRKQEAVAALEPVAARDGARYPVALYHLGRLYEQTGQLPRAAESFQRAAELYEGINPQVLVDLSRVREKTGDNAGALAAMEAYVKATEQQGLEAEWTADRLAKLRSKAGNK